MKSAFKVFTSYLFLLFIVACSGGGNVTDGGGGTPTPGEDSYSLSLALVNGSGEPTTDISNAQPGKLYATLTKNSSPLSGGRIVFSLQGEGVLTPDSGVSDADGKVSIDVLPGDKLGSGKITASYETIGGTTVEASVSFNTQGDGGAATGGAQVALILVDDLATMTPISTISSLSPGYLVATVTGISKATIVKFTSDIGELPIETAATEDGKAYVQILAGSQPGAGIATATLVTGEKAELVFKVGATNVLMGSGDPFQSEVAAVSPAVVSAGGTASISVTLQDDAGNLFSEPVEVKFSSVCANKTPAEAEISSPVVAVNGVATTTYLAKGCVGDDAINVNAVVGSKSLSAKATLNVLSASVGSIKFVEAIPELIRLKGTGGAESSTVKFQVMDKNGNPVSNQRVNFSLNSDTGDIVLDPTTATTNSQGIAQTVVNSGTVATSVRVTAVVDGSSPEISSQSNLLVISTGLPDQDSFSLSADILNPEGWDYDGVEVNITARLADAFNNPVPDGTAVSFTTEGGVIDSSCTTQDGVCSVKWKSQNPRPTGKTLFELGQEPTLGADIGQPYGGRVTILARAIGEESFPDLNGNGRFDLVEFEDFKTKQDVSGNPYDLDEAFVDHNEDGLYNPKFDGEAGGDAETFVDFNNNKEFDVADGLYNGSLCALDETGAPHAGCSSVKKSLDVRASLVLVMSGSTAVASTPIIVDSCTEDASLTDDPCKGLNGNQTIDILGKSTGGVSIIVGDLHNQPLPQGTVITFTPSAGSLASKGSYTVTSTNVNRAEPYSVTIKGADQPDAGTLIIEATTPKGDISELAKIPITIH
ncbi:Ig-like domain-containing protein [Shewanella loihica]|uniref:Ig domain protein, group 1 domain protein n=1 Tax=Shewanella loihica (strain ATCC BAA-1088 / PV-4) TaxID=323850 RepID=A3QF44_SHELP|nr:Ig-like domain-containing protein [Shewanella loihica]ABO24092.1 Ig domain protein, group 1 domain protein [Shewanella loihica PV-4]